MPASDVADPGCAIGVMDRPEHRAQTRQAAGAFALQADALARSDQAEDALAADMQAGDLGAVRWRRELADQDVADVRTRILVRDQKGVLLSGRPVDEGLFSQRVALRQNNHQLLGADRHGVQHRAPIRSPRMTAMSSLPEWISAINSTRAPPAGRGRSRGGFREIGAG